MLRDVIKEIIVFLVLLIIIGLVLAILFYDSLPATRTIPSRVVPYALPEDIMEVLQEAHTEGRSTIYTFSIDNVRGFSQFTPGKQNPFAEHVIEPPPEQGNTTNTTGGTGGTGGTGSTGATGGTSGTGSTGGTGDTTSGGTTGNAGNTTSGNTGGANGGTGNFFGNSTPPDMQDKSGN